MKRTLIVLAAFILLFPLIAQSESFVETLQKGISESISYAELGDRLIIIGEYNDFVNNQQEGLDYSSLSMDQFKDELSKYKAIVILMLKDNSIYLGAEIPLTDGVFTDGTGLPLMSLPFMQEQMRFGQ